MPRTLIDKFESICSIDLIRHARTWEKRAIASRARKQFLSVPNYTRRKEFLAHAAYGTEAYDVLLSLEIFQRCLDVFTSAALEGSVEGQAEQAPSANLALMSLCSFMSQTLSSFRREVFYGNDIGARILARSIAEAADYMTVMLYDEDLIDKFVDAKDNFKALWSEKLRPKALSKHKRTALLNFFEDDKNAVEDILSYSAQEFEVISRAVHPTYESGVMHLLFMCRKGESNTSWGFLDSWQHGRVSRFILSHASLPISISCLASFIEGRKEHLKIKLVEKSFFGVDREALVAVVDGCSLVSSFASHHAKLYSSATGADENIESR